MRHVLCGLFCLTLLAVSCKKTESNFLIPAGTYAGTFQRLISDSGQISNVTITFSENNWIGQSQYSKYPALCNGTYQVRGSENVTFENACVWTAEFDWTLILSGDYKIKVAGNDSEISKNYNSQNRDIYKLTKQ